VSYDHVRGTRGHTLKWLVFREKFVSAQRREALLAQ